MVRLTPGVIAALTLAVILTISPVLRAVTVDVAPDAEQLTTGTSAGFANLLSDDGLNWGRFAQQLSKDRSSLP